MAAALLSCSLLYLMSFMEQDATKKMAIWILQKSR